VPVCGPSRTLQDASGQDTGDKSLLLFNNTGGTLPNTNKVKYVSPNGSDTAGNGSSSLPYWSINRAISQIASESGGTTEGATVYLMPGTYTYPNTGNIEGAPNRWFTLAGAPGTSRSQVVLTGPGSGPGQKKLRVANLTLKHIDNDSNVLIQRSDPYGNTFWVDNCDMVGRGYIGTTVSSQPIVVASAAVPTYFTDVNISNVVSSSLSPYTVLVRNVSAQNMGADFLNCKKLVINASVNHMRYNSGVHPDVIQVPIGAIENMIVYGLKATDVKAQGLNIGDAAQPMRNVAVVNALLHKEITDPQQTYLGAGSVTDHLLLWNISSVNYYWNWSPSVRTNFSLRNSVISKKSPTNPADFATAVLDRLHFTDGLNVVGTNYTTGDPLFVNPNGFDFRPTSGSPLNGRVTSDRITAPCTLDLLPTVTPAPVGAYRAP
jgi:hypothetical protein